MEDLQGQQQKRPAAVKEKQTENIPWKDIIDGLQKIYRTKMMPLEKEYKFENFHSALLTDGDIAAKPLVLLIGQYSTGKTTFIRYLLGKDYPGMHIGPEPTTDRFVAVMHGKENRVTPGNAAAVQQDKPFQGLSQFGTGFLSKFQCSELPSPLLEHLTFIDTPGVLSGEKQRIGRSYEFGDAITWFAQRADMILLLFDAHKLDISDEFKMAIECLKGQDDKVRVILNKADMVNTQQLMRVYGALMWSLGKVIKTPEVCRVYIGSFWDQPLHIEDNRALIEAEMADLLADLRGLPKNSAIRKVNELIKRARLAKVHAYVISHLKEEMPYFFGKTSKQDELISQLDKEFLKVHQKYQLPVGDFPEINKFKQQLKLHDLSKLPTLNQKMIDIFEQVLKKDIPDLLRYFPQDGSKSSDVVESISKNPFEAGANAPDRSDYSFQSIDRQSADKDFFALGPTNGKLSGKGCRPYMEASSLDAAMLGKIWNLADIDKDGYLDQDEFAVAYQLMYIAKMTWPVPDKLPPTLLPPSKNSVVFS